MPRVRRFPRLPASGWPPVASHAARREGYVCVFLSRAVSVSLRLSGNVVRGHLSPLSWVHLRPIP